MEMKWIPIVNGDLSGIPRDKRLLFSGIDHNNELYVDFGYVESRLEKHAMISIEDIGMPVKSKEFTAWMEAPEPFPKPEVDWNKVPVDTLVRVRDDEDEEWLLRYFNRFDENTLDGRNYVVFGDGATSVTAEGYVESWEFCELAEVTNGK